MKEGGIEKRPFLAGASPARHSGRRHKDMNEVEVVLVEG
jgi:hypothetical protein